MEDYALPNYLITDFVATVSSDKSLDLYLMKVAVVGDSATFVIGSGTEQIASIYVDVTQHTTNKGYPFSGTGSYEDMRGCLVVGNLARFKDEFPDGVYSFEEQETLFEHRCVRPSLRKVSSISIYDPYSGYKSKKLSGDVLLVAGQNISFKYDQETNALWINADNNEGYNEKCECDNQTTVKTINGISTENVTLIGDSCVSVTTKGNTIFISDTCSKPCCGCPEVDFLNDKIAQVNTAIGKLEAYSAALQDRLTDVQSAYELSATGAEGSVDQ